jgi:hypothetical protein
MTSNQEKLNSLFSELLPTKIDQPILVQDPDVFDIQALMADAIDPDTGLIRDLRIDDRDLPQAANFYDYSLNILKGDAHPPWMMQMWTGLLLFAETCPPCSDKRYYNVDYIINKVGKERPAADILEGFQLLNHGRCPKCGRTKGELIKNHGLRNFSVLVNCLGQRSGKSSSAAGYYASYTVHRLLKFPKLSELTTATQKSTMLSAVFVALNSDRARDLLWTPFLNTIEESSWFRNYHEMLDYHGNKLGLELYKKQVSGLAYAHKGIMASYTGPKASTLRGDTRFLAVIDELGLFPLPKPGKEDTTSEMANADEAYKSLNNSLGTCQSIYAAMLQRDMNCPPPLLMCVSSPVSQKDKMMRLLKTAQTQEGKKFMLGINVPTWHINPHLDKDTGIIGGAYAVDPIAAERDFGANPPKSYNSFVKQSQLSLEIFTTKNTHSLQYCYDKEELLYGKVRCLYKPKYPSIVSIDAGHSNNSFALTAAHFDFSQQKIVVTTVLEIMTHDDRKIDFNSVYLNVIKPVLEDTNAVALLADQWQSLDILSRAREDLGNTLIQGVMKPRCLAKQISPRRKDFDNLVAALSNKAMLLPSLSLDDWNTVTTTHLDYKTIDNPIKHLLLQILTVRDDGVGRCPVKGEGYTDDLFRALVLLIRIYDEQVMERLKNFDKAIGTERRAMPKPAFASRSF